MTHCCKSMALAAVFAVVGIVKNGAMGGVPIEVTESSSVTLQPGDALDIYFRLSTVYATLPSNWVPSLPHQFWQHSYSTFAVGQPLDAFSFSMSLQSADGSISIPYSQSVLPVGVGSVSSASGTWPITVISYSVLGSIPLADRAALFASDQVRLHLDYIGTAPFTFEAVGIPSLAGATMSSGPFGGMLTAGIGLEVSIDGQPSSTGNIGFGDSILLTPVPEPSFLSLGICGALARRRAGRTCITPRTR